MHVRRICRETNSSEIVTFYCAFAAQKYYYEAALSSDFNWHSRTTSLVKLEFLCSNEHNLIWFDISQSREFTSRPDGVFYPTEVQAKNFVTRDL